VALLAGQLLEALEDDDGIAIAVFETALKMALDSLSHD